MSLVALVVVENMKKLAIVRCYCGNIIINEWESHCGEWSTLECKKCGRIWRVRTLMEVNEAWVKEG